MVDTGEFISKFTTYSLTGELPDHCQNLSSLENGGVSCSESNEILSTCDFSCSAGYFLRGSSSVTCQEDGRWSGEIPYCESKAFKRNSIFNWSVSQSFLIYENFKENLMLIKISLNNFHKVFCVIATVVESIFKVGLSEVKFTVNHFFSSKWLTLTTEL